MSALTQARTDRDVGMARAADAEAQAQPGYAAQFAAAILAVARRQADLSGSAPV